MSVLNKFDLIKINSAALLQYAAMR